jgi:hypothetical protein
MNPNYFIGPMSKNVVDAVLEFSNSHNAKMGLIPSRRQIDFNGGYVNKWTTKEFSNYVNFHQTAANILIERDHAGPMQGHVEDDGYDSMAHDVRCMDIIHIDPWKKYPIYEDGLHATIELINHCKNIQPGILFEVGTEESIRKFSAIELDKFLSDLKSILSNDTYNCIVYAVIQ